MLTVTATFVLELSPQTAHFEQNCANVSRSQSLCFRMAIKGSVYLWGSLARILSLILKILRAPIACKLSNQSVGWDGYDGFIVLVEGGC